MSCTIAVAGKGGTGKTTLSALVTASLVRSGKTPVLAVDADPNANLNEALGVTYDTTVVDTVDEIMANPDALPAGVPKGRFVEYQVHDAVVESSGFDLLVMGHTEGAGCYCYANDLLRGFIDKLAVGYKYLILDNEAGMEHLSRRTARSIDVLLIVANGTVTSLRSAARIHEIVRKLKLNVGRTCLVLNSLNAAAMTTGGNGRGPEEQLAALHDAGLPLLGTVPYDQAVFERALDATGLLQVPQESVAMTSVTAFLEELGV